MAKSRRKDKEWVDPDWKYFNETLTEKELTELYATSKDEGVEGLEGESAIPLPGDKRAQDTMARMAAKRELEEDLRLTEEFLAKALEELGEEASTTKKYAQEARGLRDKLARLDGEGPIRRSK